MKKALFYLLPAALLLLSSCDKDKTINGKPHEPEPEKSVSLVSQFVYDGLSLYYRWADEVNGKAPTPANTDPSEYFYSLLSNTDKEHGWSWITNDVDGLIASFAGEGVEAGYELSFGMIDNKVYAVVKYVFTGTPADKAGLKRLDIIGELNGQPIKIEERDGGVYVSDESLNLLYGSGSVNLTVYRLDNNALKMEKEVTVTPKNIQKDPVAYHSVLTVGDKKIGYLFYTNFVDNFDSSLYNVFSEFKREGVTDLVLDLRYNTGGSVGSALYLASMIAPRAAVESRSPYCVMDYNSELNAYFDQLYSAAGEKEKDAYDRKYRLGTHSAGLPDPLEANLNLNKVYIIATDNSYSASELTTFCLKQFMDVVHIGSNTGGKYTASWTIHPYNSDYGITVYDEERLTATEKDQLKSWAMQPIVAYYANNKSENFSTPGYLKPDYEIDEGPFYAWKPLGDPKDALLGQALYLITGDKAYEPAKASSTRHAAGIVRPVLSTREEGRPLQITPPHAVLRQFGRP